MSVVVGSSFTPTVAARACSDLKSDVASYVMGANNDRILSKAQDFLRGATDELNTRNWQWQLATQDITLVADTASYTLSGAFKAPRHAELLDSGSKARSTLGYVDPKSWAYWNVDRSSSGTPRTYTAWNPEILGTLVLDVPTSSSFIVTYPTLRLYYYALTIPCSGSVSVLSVPSQVSEFLCWRAKEQMAAQYSPQKIGYAKSRADLMWRALIREDMQSQLSDWE